MCQVFSICHPSHNNKWAYVIGTGSSLMLFWLLNLVSYFFNKYLWLESLWRTPRHACVSPRLMNVVDWPMCWQRGEYIMYEHSHAGTYLPPPSCFLSHSNCTSPTSQLPFNCTEPKMPYRTDQHLIWIRDKMVTLTSCWWRWGNSNHIYLFSIKWVGCWLFWRIIVYLSTRVSHLTFLLLFLLLQAPETGTNAPL